MKKFAARLVAQQTARPVAFAQVRLMSSVMKKPTMFASVFAQSSVRSFSDEPNTRRAYRPPMNRVPEPTKVVFRSPEPITEEAVQALVTPIADISFINSLPSRTRDDGYVTPNLVFVTLETEDITDELLEKLGEDLEIEGASVKLNRAMRMERITAETSKSVFVGNMDNFATEQDLEDFFGRVGEIDRVYIPRNPETGRPKGFCFVYFKDVETADRAINQFDSSEMMGRVLAVRKNVPRYD
uniref:RRM domain-containing protein n=1 Tax=Strombidium rassoulzadegani TaxID=1082188 RepID=A0A7S3FTI5_9SPIT|mmetsp:Transcript_14357/g.24444  ORF Transcript_14357/g.24444 Transcript_14357/m.24444 type:complete len:241 (+) Transcript_14357:33-755(+)